MLDCLILGDSVAVGTGQARPECRVEATVGVTSDRFVQTLSDLPAARSAVISLGVNDPDGTATEANLRRLRVRVDAAVVYWLVPGTNLRARDAARVVAATFHDRVIDVGPLAGVDGIHPDRAGYAKLAELTRGPAGSAYTAFPAPERVYRDFGGVNVWRGPCNLNGRPVRVDGCDAKP